MHSSTPRTLAPLCALALALAACDDAVAPASRPLGAPTVAASLSGSMVGRRDRHVPPAPFSVIRDINNRGGMAGMVGSPFGPGPRAAYRWNASSAQALGTLPGTVNCDATGINYFGHIVGYCDGGSAGQRAFLWTEDGGMRDIGPGAATAINDKDVVVGNGAGPWKWTSGGGQVALAGGGFAYDINTRGDVSGQSPAEEAIVWLATGTIVVLPTLYPKPAGESTHSSAFGINDQRMVVGMADGLVGTTAVFWKLSPTTGAVTFMTQLSQGELFGVAYEVSETGVASGEQESDEPGAFHPYLWTASGESLDLGTLSGPYENPVCDDDGCTDLPLNYGVAYAVNDRGEAVGRSHQFLPDGSSEQHATYWSVRPGSPAGARIAPLANRSAASRAVGAARATASPARALLAACSSPATSKDAAFRCALQRRAGGR